MAETGKSWGPVFLFVLGAGIIARLVWPFFPGLVLAAVLATLVVPRHQRTVLARIKSPSLAAGVTTILLVLLLLIPLSGLLFMVGTESVAALDWLTTGDGLNNASNGFQVRLTRWVTRLGMDPDTAVTLVTTQLRRVTEVVMGRSLTFLSGIPGVLLQLGVALFALFYLLRDADEFMSSLRRMIPLDPQQTEEVLQRARDITEATVYGTVVVAIAQGILGGIAFRVVGLAPSALWGAIMGVMAMIPMVGPAVVWLPASIYLVITGSVLPGVLLAAFGALVIGTVDNLLRAIFVSGRAQVHSLVVFLSVLGGVFAFGPAGLVVGPVLFVLALIAIEMGRLAMDHARWQAIRSASTPESPPTPR